MVKKCVSTYQPVFLIPAAIALMDRNSGFIQGLSAGLVESISRTLRSKYTCR